MNQPNRILELFGTLPGVVDDQVILHGRQPLAILIRELGCCEHLSVVQRPHEHIFHDLAIAGLNPDAQLDHSGIHKRFEFLALD